jgi:hypothetical protein
MIDGDQLLADIRDIFHTRRAEWLSLSCLVADLRRQPYAAYHARSFYELVLKRRLADFDVVTVRRGPRGGIAWDDLLRDRIRRFAPGAPNIVRLALGEEEADGGPTDAD